MDDSAECTQFPVALNNAIGDYLRRQADKVDMGYLVEVSKFDVPSYKSDR